MIVERYIKGDEHACLGGGRQGGGGRAWREPVVMATASSSVARLIDLQLNTDPRRGEEEEFPKPSSDREARSHSSLAGAPGPDR